jgi:hypothetical protein
VIPALCAYDEEIHGSDDGTDGTQLEKERKKRYLDSIPETIRMIVSEYLSKT